MSNYCEYKLRLFHPRKEVLDRARQSFLEKKADHFILSLLGRPRAARQGFSLSLALVLGAALALISLVFLLLRETRRLALLPGIALLLLGMYVALWSQRRFLLPARLIAAASIPVIVLSLTLRRTP